MRKEIVQSGRWAQSNGVPHVPSLLPSESIGFSPSSAIHDGVPILVKDHVHAVVMTLHLDDVDAPSSVLYPHDVDGLLVYKYEASREDGRCGLSSLSMRDAVNVCHSRFAGANAEGFGAPMSMTMSAPRNAHKQSAEIYTLAIVYRVVPS